MCETLQFLDCICGSTTGGLGLLGLYINEKNVALINQTLESLTEYCQGPCHENQVRRVLPGPGVGWRGQPVTLAVRVPGASSEVPWHLPVGLGTRDSGVGGPRLVFQQAGGALLLFTPGTRPGPRWRQRPSSARRGLVPASHADLTGGGAKTLTFTRRRSWG